MNEISVAESFDGPASPSSGGQDASRCADDPIVALTEGLKRGDEAAYREFHRGYHHRLRRYCLALASGDDDRADEIVQRTYLRVTRSMKRLPHEAALWQWLVVAARCAAIDLARGRKRYAALLARFGERFRRTRENPERMEDLAEVLDGALAQLGSDERQIVEEKYFEGRRASEIASAAGLTVKAVEGRLARARKRLRALISKSLTEPSS